MLIALTFIAGVGVGSCFRYMTGFKEGYRVGRTDAYRLSIARLREIVGRK